MEKRCGQVLRDWLYYNDIMVFPQEQTDETLMKFNNRFYMIYINN